LLKLFRKPSTHNVILDLTRRVRASLAPYNADIEAFEYSRTFTQVQKLRAPTFVELIRVSNHFYRIMSSLPRMRNLDSLMLHPTRQSKFVRDVKPMSSGSPGGFDVGSFSLRVILGRLFEGNTHSISPAPDHAGGQDQIILRHNQCECVRHVPLAVDFDRGSGHRQIADNATSCVFTIANASGLGHFETGGTTGFYHRMNSTIDTINSAATNKNISKDGNLTPTV
jgi:hypothetical protein